MAKLLCMDSNKMYLLMQKQVNRGQDGAGIVNIKLDVKPGFPYISRRRSVDQNSIQDVFSKISDNFKRIQANYPEKFKNPEWLKENCSFTGEVFLGHLRYGTYGGNNITCYLPTSKDKTTSIKKFLWFV